MSDSTILVAVQLPIGPVNLEPVMELAARTGWPVRILHVSPPETAMVRRAAGGGDDDEVDIQFSGRDDLAAEHGELLELRTRFTAAGIETELEVLPGPSVDVMLAYAEAWNAAFIAVIGRIHRLTTGRALGSVTTTLLKAADRPVLVLPEVEEDVGHTGYLAAVERLVDVIDREDHDEDASELREAAVLELVRSPASIAETEEGDDERRNPATRLRDALHRFETDHPSLTSAINDVSYYLSGMGI